jgi:hypothetical protein
LPGRQSASVAHRLGHAGDEPEQTNGEQDGLPKDPLGRVVQMPEIDTPGPVQALHSPTHAELQHTPSAQKRVMHWFPAVHGFPIGCGGSHLELVRLQ